MAGASKMRALIIIVSLSFCQDATSTRRLVGWRKPSSDETVSGEAEAMIMEDAEENLHETASVVFGLVSC